MGERQCECGHPVSEHGFEGCIHTYPAADGYVDYCQCVTPYGGDGEDSGQQCTCEYPYPREIWDGHHPDCATLNREENSQP